MVLRLQNNLNLGPAQSAMAAAAELSIEAARAKARGMEGFASGLAGGVKTYVGRKDEKRREAESTRRFDLSRSDANDERAADNARADRALQQQADIHNASMNYKIWEDADKDIAAAVQANDQAAFEAATKRKQAAGAGLQLAQQKPHVVAEAERMGILAIKPRAGPNANPEGGVDLAMNGRTPAANPVTEILTDAEKAAKGKSAPVAGGPSVTGMTCGPNGCDTPTGKPAAPPPSGPQAALMDALTTEAAAQAAYDKNKAILDNKNERSWERKEEARAQEPILLGALARAKAYSDTAKTQAGAEVTAKAKAKEAEVAKRSEMAQFNAALAIRTGKRPLTDGEKALLPQAQKMVAEGAPWKEAFSATFGDEKPDALHGTAKGLEDADAEIARRAKVEAAEKRGEITPPLSRTDADTLGKRAGEIEKMKGEITGTTAAKARAEARAVAAVARVKDHERLKALEPQIDALVEKTGKSDYEGSEKDWTKLGELRAEYRAIVDRTKVPFKDEEPAPATPAPVSHPVAPATAPASAPPAATFDVAGDARRTYGKDSTKPGMPAYRKPPSGSTWQDTGEFGRQNDAVISMLLAGDLTGGLPGPKSTRQAPGTFARESDAAVSTALIGDRTQIDVQHARAIFDREVAKRGLDPKSPEARRIAEAIKAGLVR